MGHRCAGERPAGGGATDGAQADVRAADARASTPVDELLGDADRDRIPGARSVIALAPDEDEAFERAVLDASCSTLELSRRGAWHGTWAVLRGHANAVAGELARRWQDARPIALPAAVASEVAELAPLWSERLALHEELKEPGGLRAFVAAAEADLAPSFRLLSRSGGASDPERDIERVWIESLPPSGRGKRIRDLWLKSAWLSTSPDEDSLRLRASFGSERDDDASRDLLRQRLVAEVAGLLLPELALARAPAIASVVENLCAEPVLCTQPIAYWNAPDGGALFHHDAFDEDALGGQLGVLFLQLSGSTAWLALSIDDLAARVRELVLAIEDEGALDWLPAQLYGARGPGAASGWSAVVRLAHDPAALVRELGLPGLGRLGPLVNRGPEVTGFLADGGHALVLEPGDALLLPNHGLARTAMHSVFCASDEVTYALSMALRSQRQPPEANQAPRMRSRRSRTRR